MSSRGQVQDVDIYIFKHSFATNGNFATDPAPEEQRLVKNCCEVLGLAMDGTKFNPKQCCNGRQFLQEAQDWRGCGAGKASSSTTPRRSRPSVWLWGDTTISEMPCRVETAAEIAIWPEDSDCLRPPSFSRTTMACSRTASTTSARA